MKRWIARAMILCMGILLMGCQKTPEQAVVIGKENDGWEDAAAAEDETTQLGAPERYQAEYQWKDLTVQINAQVDAPEEQVYPVYILERAVFSQELADRMMDALVGDRPLYRVENGRTKGTIQQEIDYYTKELRTDGQMEEHLQHFQEILAELIAEKEQAPESPERVEASRELGYVWMRRISAKNTVTPWKPRTAAFAISLRMRAGVRQNLTEMWASAGGLRMMRELNGCSSCKIVPRGAAG